MKNLFVLLSFVILFSGCSKKTDNRSVIKFIGGYTSILPCTDCKGINYELILNEDMTYLETKIYLGKNSKPFQSTGRWELEDKDVIKIFKKSDEFSLFEYKNKNLIMLNAKGKTIEGPEEDKYVLKPGGMQIVQVDTGDSLINTSDSITIKGFWTLTELNGQKMALENFKGGLPEIDINTTDKNFKGSSGCNRINGAVKISGDKVVFSDFVSTKMRCPGTSESEFISALESVDAYKIDGRVLNLTTADKIVMKFVR